MGTKLKNICSWCGKDMGEIDGQGQEGVSHGMCEECQVEWEKDMPPPQPEKKEGK